MYSIRKGYKYLGLYCFNTELTWVLSICIYKFEFAIEYRKGY